MKLTEHGKDNPGDIAREERCLEGTFGTEYRRYKGSVRRWL